MSSMPAVALSRPPPDRLRVLVVDDDPVYRQILTRILSEMPGVELVGTCATVALAKAKIESTAIDVVTIDVVLRDESGLDLLKWLRTEKKDVVAALLTSGGDRLARTEVDAALLGAVALVTKPAGPDAKANLTASVRTMLEGVRKRHVVKPQAVRLAQPERHFAVLREVIAGGPPVVMKLLQSLRPSFDTPILITQHMPASHIPYFAALLAKQSGRNVAPARDLEPVVPGRVYVASEARHMTVVRQGASLVIRQNDGPEEHNCKPAVDPLFRSVADVVGAAAVGVVITGMGSDGALGAIALRSRGAPVVAQDEATSVVWGMPGATVAAGGADAVSPGDDLAQWVMKWTLGTKAPAP